MVDLHGIFNLLPLPAGELTTPDIGDHHHQAVRTLPSQAVIVPACHGVSGSGNQQVSFQQDLIRVVVGGQNPCGDVHAVCRSSSTWSLTIILDINLKF